jgi:hypothetical protein
MGKYSKGILGDVTGSVGNIQGYNHNNQNIIRSKQIKRKDADTMAQRQHRNRFNGLLRLYKEAPESYLDLISEYWNPQISIWHSMMPVIPTFRSNGIPYYRYLWLTDGPVDHGTWADKTWYPDESLLQVTWDTAAGQPGNVKDEDLLYYFIYCKDRNEYKFDMTGYARGVGNTIDYYIEPLEAGYRINVFNFYYRPSTGEFSKFFNWAPWWVGNTFINP